MSGFVDDQLRALLRVPVSASRDGDRTDLVVWIDTAFNGGLAIPRKQVAELALSKQSSAEAILADGRSVELETFACFLDWFGNTYETQIAASDGEYPLLGTMLLDGHRLDINYAAKTVELTEWAERADASLGSGGPIWPRHVHAPAPFLLRPSQAVRQIAEDKACALCPGACGFSSGWREGSP